jgi:hypothetical protein
VNLCWEFFSAARNYPLRSTLLCVHSSWVDLISFCLVAQDLLAESCFGFSTWLLIFSRRPSIDLRRFSSAAFGFPIGLCAQERSCLSRVVSCRRWISGSRSAFRFTGIAIGSGPGFCFLSRTLSASASHLVARFQVHFAACEASFLSPCARLDASDFALRVSPHGLARQRFAC